MGLGGNVLRFARSNAPDMLALLGLTFLWPYYQRAFFRVTLFHRLGDASELNYSLFLATFLIGSLLLSFLPSHKVLRGANDRKLVLAVAVVAAVSTLYLSGLVSSATEGFLVLVLGALATLGYAGSLLVLSAFWAVLLVRIVYARGLSHAVVVLTASSMLGLVVSPSFSSSPFSSGFVPLFGITIASACAWFECKLMVEDAESPHFQPLFQAPYIKTWIAPLVAYVLFAVSHAIGYVGHTTTEVYVEDGHLMAASSSFANYAVFFLFSAIILLAAAQSWRGDHDRQEKATFWVAGMGISVGLFMGLFLANVLADPSLVSLSALTSITPCFPILLAVIALFSAYQNRLSPLQSFGLFFFVPYSVDKLFAYVVLPPIIMKIGMPSAEVSQYINGVIYAVSLLALLIFLAQFCRADTLRMLFSSGGGTSLALDESEEEDKRHQTCLALANQNGLTKRELDILAYLSLGYSAKRIGEVLFISERTVQTHTRNIYRKLDVHTRQDVIDLFRREGAAAETGSLSKEAH